MKFFLLFQLLLLTLLLFHHQTIILASSWSFGKILGYAPYNIPGGTKEDLQQADMAGGVTFHLYTNNSNVQESQQLCLNDTAGILKAFLPGKPVKILIHGFLNSFTSPLGETLKNAYLKEANGTITRNIIVVGWESLAFTSSNPAIAVPGYIKTAIKNVPEVGKKVGHLVEILIDRNFTRLSLIHAIGHSLGAHVAGVMGDYVYARYARRVGRITGLDPAGPLFYSHILGRPLTLHDARFVDLIHTNQFALGRAASVGHADFYPDGGTFIQKNCRGSFGTGLAKEIMTAGMCSHSEAFVLYRNSIGSTKMRGCKCSSYTSFKAKYCPCVPGDQNDAIFGEKCSPDTEGSFYLDVDKWMEEM